MFSNECANTSQIIHPNVVQPAGTGKMSPKSRAKKLKDAESILNQNNKGITRSKGKNK